MDSLIQDIRYGVRHFLRNPGFTAVAMMALALGIGANTAIFSVVNSVLLRPLPYHEPGQLVRIMKEAPPGGGPVIGGGDLVGGNEFLAWKEQSQLLAKVAAYEGSDFNLTGVDTPERIVGGEVTSDFFPLLGIQPLIGRVFTSDEDRPNAPKVVVLGHGLWQRRFGGDPKIVGGILSLNNNTYTVVGVLPASFHFAEPYELWLPLSLDHAAEQGEIRIALVRALARLKPGVGLEQARVEIETINQRLNQNRTSPNPGGPIPFDSRPGLRPPGLGGDLGNLPLPPRSSQMIVRRFDPKNLPANPPPIPSSNTEQIPGVDAIGLGLPGIPPESTPVGPSPARVAPATQPSDGIRQDVLTPMGVGLTPPFGSQSRIKLIGLHEHVVANVRTALLALLGAVGFVLCIACANVANLLLARAAARQKEIAVRGALGAGRGRLVRQCLTESVILSTLGGAMGLLFAFWTSGIFRSFVELNLPQSRGIGVDATVLLFTALVSLGTGVVFGLAPALQILRSDLNEILKGDAAGAIGLGRQWFRNFLVVSEVALALVLLVSAGLLINSFFRLRSVNLGLNPEGLLTMQVNLPQREYNSPERTVAFFQSLIERLKALPGVKAVAATDHLAMTDYAMMSMIQVQGAPQSALTRQAPVSISSVSDDYFQTMGIPLRSGRHLTVDDRQNTPGVVVVNEAFARRYFPSSDPLGKRLDGAGPGGSGLTIVGVVGNTRQSLTESETPAEVYRPMAQSPSSRMSVVIRSPGNPLELALEARNAVRDVDSDQPVFNLLTMEERVSATTASRRMNMLLMGSFAGLALALAAVGIYGVMSCLVTQRTREIGVRLALGAQPTDVITLIMRQGMKLAGIGILLGMGTAFCVTRLLRNLLFGVGPADPLTFFLIAVLLTAVALIASYLPARRALQIDPVNALRHD